jgi:hypothetical protein
MTPQASFLYAAPILAGREDALRSLLASMNRSPGVFDPDNALVPFQHLDGLHYARLLVVTDLGASDRAMYNLSTCGLPDYLVLMGEIDGEEDTFREKLVASAGEGLARLFGHCEGYRAEDNVSTWLAAHHVIPAAAYVNWVGRTVEQVREEEALREAIEGFLQRHQAEVREWTSRQKHQQLANVARELKLTPSTPTPLAWQLRSLVHLIGVPLLLLLLSPFLLLYLPFFLITLRLHERNDPGVSPPVSPQHAAQLFALENHDVTNQFSVFGSLKPGRARLWSVRFFLWLSNYAARHDYTRGGLARVSTIHFARWVFFDEGQRMLFSSVYDGSLESYMDDFINKVGFGLNITFSNGIGYPRTRWLVLDGCQDEQTFKRVLRRHELATEVWYSAHPGLTAANKHRNSLIRDGVENDSMTDGELAAWLALF